MVLRSKYIICCFFIANSLLGQGKCTQDSIKTQNLDEVVITATRTERQLSSLPLPATIISSSQIYKSGVSRLNEILSEQTGLVSIPDFGGVEGIQIQGLDAAYTMILIDGVPLVGRSAGTLDLSRISVGNIEKIEIVKGASSSLYGSEALAGVINIITKKPSKETLTGKLSAKYASFNAKDLNADMDWKKKKFSGSLFTNYFSTDGYDLDKTKALQTVEPYYNATFHPKFHYDFSDRLKLTFSNRFFYQKQDHKAIIDGGIYAGDAVVREWNLQVKLSQKVNRNTSLEYEMYATNYKTDAFLNDESDVLFEKSKYDQWLLRPEIRGNYSFENNKLTGGLGVNYETLNRTHFENTAQFNSQYLFLQDDYNPSEKWNVLVGLRFDHQSQLSPKIAVNYKATKEISIKSSLGYGFKAPDFRQLFFDFTNAAVGYTVLGYNVAERKLDELERQGQIVRKEGITFDNPLKPESSVNFNLGASRHKKNFKIDINGFHNAITNGIETQVVAEKNNGQNVFSYRNIKKTFTYGVELNTTVAITDNFKISAGYQYLIAKDRAVVDALGKAPGYARDTKTLQSYQINKSDYFGLFNRSKHTTNLKLHYAIPQWKTNMNLRVFYRSKFGLLDTNSNQIFDRYDAFVKGYAMANFSISKEIKDNCQIQFGINNLFDFTSPDSMNNIAGRQLFARLQFNL